MVREHFSQIGFILVAVGAAIGLGNIWRFPYMVGSNGGGSFLFAYLISLLVVGIPLLMLELAVGRTSQSSFLTTYEKIRPWLKYVSIIILFFTSFMVIAYYLVVNGWSLGFALFSLIGFPSFSAFASSWLSYLFFAIALFIVVFVVILGIKRGIEKFVKVLMPFLFLFILVLLIYAFTLPGFNAGIAFYLTPDFSALLNLKIWILAFSQAMFSLSVGTGAMIVYSSYFGGHIRKPLYWIVLADSLIAIASGFIIFPIVFTFGLEPASGVGLSFEALPLVFQQMGSIGIFLGFLFFALLSIAALTSAVSLFENIESSLADFLKLTKKKTRNIMKVILGLCILAVGSIFAFNIDLLGKADLWFGSVALVVSSLISVIVLTRYVKFETIKNEINKWDLKFLYKIAKYVTPIILIALLFFIKYL
jgi:neurotransmitter:Na+ symporter, NSS family